MDWQPIETAPVGWHCLVADSRLVSEAILFDRNSEWIAHANNETACDGYGDMDYLSFAPTHWMPLPEPPNAEKEQGTKA